MNETKVDSTTLLAVAYDGAGEILRLEFRNRAIYHYFGVPAALHEALLEAASKGSCFKSGNPRTLSLCFSRKCANRPGG